MSGYTDSNTKITKREQISFLLQFYNALSAFTVAPFGPSSNRDRDKVRNRVHNLLLALLMKQDTWDNPPCGESIE